MSVLRSFNSRNILLQKLLLNERYRGVQPYLFWIFGFVLRFASNISIMSVPKVICTALKRGVKPSLSTLLTLILGKVPFPIRRRTLTISVFFKQTATFKAVLPSLSTLFILTPLRNQYFTCWIFPFFTAAITLFLFFGICRRTLRLRHRERWFPLSSK